MKIALIVAAAIFGLAFAAHAGAAQGTDWPCLTVQ
jgi:hypothetical protein